jgi:hypothetical protein
MLVENKVSRNFYSGSLKPTSTAANDGLTAIYSPPLGHEIDCAYLTVRNVCGQAGDAIFKLAIFKRSHLPKVIALMKTKSQPSAEDKVTYDIEDVIQFTVTHLASVFHDLSKLKGFKDVCFMFYNTTVASAAGKYIDSTMTFVKSERRT